MRDNLEKAFHDALINQEVAYDPKAWDALKKELPATKNPLYLGAAAATLLLTAGILWFTVLQNDETATQKIEVVQNQGETITPQVSPVLENNTPENEGSVVINNNDDAEKPANTPIQKPKQTTSTNISTQHQSNKASIDEQLSQIRTTPPTYLPNRPMSSGDEEKATLWLKDVEKIEIQGLNSSYCENAQVTLRAVNVPQNTEVSWNLENGKMINGNVAQFKAKRGMEISLSYSPKVAFRQSNPIAGITIKPTVLEAEKPTVEVLTREQNTKNFVTLSNSNSNVEHLVWRFENTTVKGQSTSAYLTTKGTHEYTVESYDKNGCFSTTTGQIDIKEEYNLYAQKGFSPNGDGLNDVFMPEALKARNISFKMSIFDKIGRLVYATTDIHAPWDGTWNGQTLGSDTFVWTVSLINEEGAPELYTGTVTIVR